jgi:hypothetical protein
MMGTRIIDPEAHDDYRGKVKGASGDGVSSM